MEPIAGNDEIGHGGLPSGMDIVAAIVKNHPDWSRLPASSLNGAVSAGAACKDLRLDQGDLLKANQ